MGLAPAGPAPPVQRQVDREAVKPRAEPAVAPEVAQPRGHPHEHLLGHVLGVGLEARAEDRERDSEHVALVQGHEPREGGGIPGADPGVHESLVRIHDPCGRER